VPGTSIQRIGNVFYRVAEQDMDAAVRFYSEVLGFPVKLRDGNRWVAFDVAGVTLALEGGATVGGPGGATVSLRVDGLTALVDELRAQHASVGDVQAGPHENRATLTDPAGNQLVLYEPAPR
jgi:catechol 2,3-dioxygenase-like lactoylglutathione lyase family enzyme